VKRFAIFAAIFAVASVAGVASYLHIYELSLALHQSKLIAAVMPFGVDGLVVVGSVVLLSDGGRLGWLGVGPGVAISLFANIESGIRYGWLAAVWAGIPAVSFFAACYLLENWLKSHASASAADAAPVPVAIEHAVTVAPVPTAPATATATRPATAKPTVKAPKPRQRDASGSDMERRARRVMARQPDITGAELGRAIGASPRTGQRLLAQLKERTPVAA
jgi:hypothetical protein